MRTFSGPHGSVRRGEILRADDPRRTQAPTYFVDQETLEHEELSPFDYVVAENERRERDEREQFERAASNNRIVLKVNTRTLRRDLVLRHDGEPVTIVKGSVVVADHQLVRDHPDAWR
jgi:hypothetical protein